MGGLQFFCTSVDQPEALNFNSNFDMNTTVNRLRPFSGHWTLSVLISWLIVLHHIQNMASFCIASKGDVELLEKCVEAMNAKSDPSEEEINRLNRQNIRKNNFNTSNFHQFLRECKHCSHIMPYHHIHMPHMYHSTGS
jgi:hypothetical protein